MTPREAYERAFDNGPSKELEEIIAKDPWHSHCYAEYILKRRFPRGEATIAKDAFWSLAYSFHIVKGPFPAGEAAISRDADSSYQYATQVLKSHFKKGEKQIAKVFQTTLITLDYQFRFNRNICSEQELYKYPLYALAYAIMIGGRFPAGEPAMRNSPRIWKRYQEFIDDTRRSV